MIYWQLFKVFLYTNLIGYGGGPATIPLIEKEVVGKYHWMITEEFSNTLGLANALPGPIATKMAGYIGYEEAGVLGALISLLATIAPSVILMLLLLSLLNAHKDSPRVKRLTTFVLPAIALLMAQLALNFFHTSTISNGWLLTILGVSICYILLDVVKINAIYLIVAGLILGGLFLG
ncbi:MAG: chromate transporter [Kurthia sp.]|nr:chromate transporter [Candidatus Kurthia equi]